MLGLEVGVRLVRGGADRVGVGHAAGWSRLRGFEPWDSEGPESYAHRPNPNPNPNPKSLTLTQ